jgi:hypothetical protein
LDEPKTEKIVSNRGESKTNHKESGRSLPPTWAGAAPFRLVGGAAPVTATRHCVALVVEKAGLGWQRLEG